MKVLRDNERRWVAWTLLLGGILLLALRPLMFRPAEPRSVTWKELVWLIDGQQVTEAVVRPDRVIGVMRAPSATGLGQDAVTVAATWSPDIDRSAFLEHVRGQGIPVARGEIPAPGSVRLMTWLLPLGLLALLYLVVGTGGAARRVVRERDGRRRQTVPSGAS